MEKVFLLSPVFHICLNGLDSTQLSKGNKISSGWEQDRKFQTKNFIESFKWMKPGIHSWTCLCTLFYNQATVIITTVLLMCVNYVNIVTFPLDWVYASVTEVIAWEVSSAVFPGKPGEQVTPVICKGLQQPTPPFYMPLHCCSRLVEKSTNFLPPCPK